MDEDGEGEQHLGELTVDVGMEFYQGPEDFYPLEGEVIEPPFDAVNAAMVQPIVPLTEFNVTTDLVNVADPTGTYPDAPFPDVVTPAPRTAGPDGRAEGGLLFEFPQE